MSILGSLDTSEGHKFNLTLLLVTWPLEPLLLEKGSDESGCCVCLCGVLPPRTQPSTDLDGSQLVCTTEVQARAWALVISQAVDSRSPSPMWGGKIKHGILSWVDRIEKWRGFGPWPSWTLGTRLLLSSSHRPKGLLSAF